MAHLWQLLRRLYLGLFHWLDHLQLQVDVLHMAHLVVLEQIQEGNRMAKCFAIVCTNPI